MKQRDFRLSSPQWPLGPAGASGSKALVGGVPWASEVGGQDQFAGRLAADGENADRERSGIGLPRVFEPAAGAAAALAAGDGGGFRDRLAAFVRNSPAFSVSLSLHCLLLLLLTLWVVRERPLKKLRLSLAFGPANIQANDTGIGIVPAKAPEKQPEKEKTEVAKTNLTSVNDPNSAPVARPELPDAGLGIAAAEKPMVAPAVGMLLAGREAGRKEVLLGAAGGGDETERAVALALDWLQKQQNAKTGLWSLIGPYGDGGSQENEVAATAMSLLAFQGAGSTLTEGPHRAVVARAWHSLLKAQQEDGSFDVGQVPLQHALYSHAQATMALCELYGMSRDPKLAEPAARAVAYCVAAQGPNGGWRYEPGKPGDMSVTGWYMMALKTAEMAGMNVPAATFEGIGGFLDTVANGNGSRYGYKRDSTFKPASPVTAAVTAEGLLCRQYLGWPQRDQRLVDGLEFLMVENPLPVDLEKDQTMKDVYAWYYITQVAHHMEGEAWRRWNERLREVLPRGQVAKEGKHRGSWDPSLDKWGSIGGRLFVTSFYVYMLETYYRHLPLYAAQQEEEQ
jgi:hypothetical protein